MEISGPVYEMLWDCRYCGEKKLLGLTHRHCPQCGAPQNADARYFPPDAEKTPAKEHAYYGADVKCAACGEANSKNSKHCRGCGGPLEGAVEVQKRADQIGDAQSKVHAFQPAPDVKAKKRGWIKKAAIGGGVAGSVGLLVGAVAWTAPGQLRVVETSWQRSIAIERFGPAQDFSWCDEMPSGARNVKRSREERSTRKVEDGQDCVTTKVDLGNGTFTEKEQCTARYREEPEYDDRCRYEIDRWQVSRTERAQGNNPAEAPRWPSPSLGRAGQCVGCEREGARKQTYSVLLKDAGGREHHCDVSEERWAQLAPGAAVVGELSVMTGALSCDSLKRSE